MTNELQARMTIQNDEAKRQPQVNPATRSPLLLIGAAIAVLAFVVYIL